MFLIFQVIASQGLMNAEIAMAIGIVLWMSAKALGVGQIDIPEVIQHAENADLPLRELMRENCALMSKC